MIPCGMDPEREAAAAALPRKPKKLPVAVRCEKCSLESPLRHATERDCQAERIIAAVASAFRLTPVELRHRRVKQVVIARHTAAYLLHHAGYSLPEVGRITGGYQHTTAIYGVRRIARLKAWDAAFALQLERIAATAPVPVAETGVQRTVLNKTPPSSDRCSAIRPDAFMGQI